MKKVLSYAALLAVMLSSPACSHKTTTAVNSAADRLSVRTVNRIDTASETKTLGVVIDRPQLLAICRSAAGDTVLVEFRASRMILTESSAAERRETLSDSIAEHLSSRSEESVKKRSHAGAPTWLKILIAIALFIVALRGIALRR